MRSNGFKRGSFSPFGKGHEHSLSPDLSALDESVLSSRACGCMNHPEKKAKYMSEGDDDEPYYYCSKCAIRLVSQGFKVTEIAQKQPSPPKPHNYSSLNNSTEEEVGREKEINSLLAEIQTVRPKLQNNLALLQRMRQDFSQHYKGLLGKQDQAFDRLIE